MWEPGLLAGENDGQKKIYLALPISQFLVDQIEDKGLAVEMQDREGEFVDASC